MNYLDELRQQFNYRIDFRLKRKEIYQILIPVFHEDGDMIEIYLDMTNPEKIRICDFGMTIMRLSYEYDIDTPRKTKVLDKILSENRVQEENGNIFLDMEPDNLYGSVMQISQVIAKVSGMKYFKREVIKSLFYEDLDNYIINNLKKYHPIKNTNPIEEEDELVVDYEFQLGKRPIYLFGIRDGYKARLVALCCKTFMLKELNFMSFIVHENLLSLSKRDQAIITSASDKQFPDLEDFFNNGEKFLKREVVLN